MVSIVCEKEPKIFSQLNKEQKKTLVKANEVDHLQTMIEKHYWLFGEEYSLVTAEEPNFEEALRRYLYILEDDEKKVEMEAKNKRKQMDIFAVKRNVNNGKIENIVVELKHTTNVKLGKKQLDQVIE